MNTHMNDTRITTLAQVRAFAEGSTELEIRIEDKAQRYGFIQRSLIRFGYNRLNRPDKGLLLQYMARISGYSMVTIKRLAADYLKHGRIGFKHTTTRGFARTYTDDDCRLLAELDALHNTLSGPATKKLCERALLLYDDQRYLRLAGISVSHLYNLRRSKPYQRVRQHFDNNLKYRHPTQARATRPDCGVKCSADLVF